MTRTDLIFCGISAVEAPLSAATGSGADDPVLGWCARWRTGVDRSTDSAARVLEWILACVYAQHGAPANSGWRTAPERSDLGPIYAAADHVLRAVLDSDDRTAMGRIMEARDIVTRYLERAA